MKNYIITYWLRHPEKDYMSFYDSIKTNYPKYIHIMEETWFIKTNDSAKEILNKIKPELARDDSIFINEIGEDKAGWMGVTGWNFLKLENEYEMEWTIQN